MGQSYSLWRSVDLYGVVLEEIPKSKSDIRAATTLLIKLMKRWGFLLKMIIAEKLRADRAAKCKVSPSLDQQFHRKAIDRAENCHRPLQSRGQVMHGIRPPGRIQRFASCSCKLPIIDSFGYLVSERLKNLAF